MSVLAPEEREGFLKNIITEVRVETLDKQTNRLKIEFLTPIVDDTLEWKNPKDKRLGKEKISVFTVKEFDKKQDEYKQKQLKEDEPY